MSKTFIGKVIPINESNVDTDKIIPAAFLTTITKTGLGKHLFDRVRIENADSYPLNDPLYKNATIMLCRENFGCGSSREHAAWAIKDAGFKVLIGTNFLDIFKNNCQLNGIWIIELKPDEVEKLFETATEVTIDIEKCKVNDEFSFKIDPFYHEIFMTGLDPIDYLATVEADTIAKFEFQYNKI